MNNNDIEINPRRPFFTPLTAIIIFIYLFPSLVVGLVFPLVVEYPLVRYLVTILANVLFAAAALWAMKKDGITLKEIGLDLRNGWQALVMVVVFWLLMALVYFVIAGAGGLQVASTLDKILQQWLFVGLGEELLFRGYLLNRLVRSFAKLGRRGSVAAGVALSSLIFATFHIPVRLFTGFDLVQMLVSMGMVFVIGVFFSYIFLRTRNILFTALIHGGWNAPLMGAQSDFIQMAAAVVVVEASAAFARFTRRKAPTELPPQAV